MAIVGAFLSSVVGFPATKLGLGASASNRRLAATAKRSENSGEPRGFGAGTASLRRRSGSPSRATEIEERAKDLIEHDGGPPRWFSPMESASRSRDAPLLLYLPGIDGVGLGLAKHHQRLGEMFDIWCLHVPVEDRTSFEELVKLVQRTIISEHRRSPNKPIYLVGETIGACLALSVAALNPDIDLVLILVNSATSFSKSRLQPLIPLLEIIPEFPNLSLPSLIDVAGDSLTMVKAGANQGLPLPIFQELSHDLVAMSGSY